MGFLESFNISGVTLGFIALKVSGLSHIRKVPASLLHRKPTVLTDTLGALPRLLKEIRG
jgi:hypothetical protein